MSCVYFGSHKAKILSVDKDSARVLYDGSIKTVPIDNLSIRIERDVDGEIIPDKFLAPLLEEDLEPYQTIAFDDEFGVYQSREGSILKLVGEATRSAELELVKDGVFHRHIDDALGIIMVGEKIVNDKLLRSIE